MNDFDLERLAQVWREEPPAAEVEEMRRAAAQASKSARRAGIFNWGAAALVAGLVLLLVTANPRIETALAGGGAILVMLTSQARQRRLQALELKSLTGGTEQMLDQLIARTQAALKRTRFSLLAMGPATLVGIFFAYVAENRRARELFPQEVFGPWLIVALILILTAVSVHFVRTIRKARKELERLKAMQESYRNEREESTRDLR